jgi:hypothetical protein
MSRRWSHQCCLVVLLLLPAARAAAGEPVWRYDVTVAAEARELAVVASFAPGYAEELSVDDGAEPFVRDVAVAVEGGSDGWRAVAPRGGSWFVPGCRRRGCRVRYRFELTRAAAALDSETAGRLGAATQAPPSTWLLRPLHPPPGRDYRLAVTTPPGLRFVSGVHRAADGSFGADVATLSDAPYSVFGPLAVENVAFADGAIEVAFVAARRQVSNAQIAAALRRAGETVRAYLRRFPVERLLVVVTPSSGDELHGRTMGTGGVTLLLGVGDGVDSVELSRSWVLVHELVHVAFPTVPRDQLWIAEGLATYVEPIARARAGELPAEKVWRDLVDGLPQGQPERGDRGLDRTHTWGRTYWGGALFCLVADVEIRERTDNRRSLDDALRAIVDKGGTLAASWPLERALRIGDEATGVPVLTELRRKMGATPMPVDLDALWARLGIARRPHEVGRLRFDDGAPLAAVRKAITAP